MIVIANVRLIDGLADAARGPVDVVVDGERIAAIRAAATGPTPPGELGATRIDGTGRTLLAGHPGEPVLRQRRHRVERLAVDEAVVDLVGASRSAAGVQLGASPRASLALMKAAQARLAGKTVDGKALSEKVRARLA